MTSTSKSAREFINLNEGDRMTSGRVDWNANEVEANVDSDADENGVFAYYTNQPTCECCDQQIEGRDGTQHVGDRAYTVEYFVTNRITWTTEQCPNVDTAAICDDCASSFTILIREDGIKE